MYRTSYRGVLLPGAYNYDGFLRCFPIRKRPVKRLWSPPYHWFKAQNNWIYRIPSIGLNVYQSRRLYNQCWWFPYRRDVITYLMNFYQFDIRVINDQGEEVLRSDLQWRFVRHPPRDGEMYLVSAYSPIDGGFVGDPEIALRHHNQGIIPEKAETDSQWCQIGFCEREQRWYGWARAIYGFGIGSSIKKGSIAYIPNNPKEIIDDMLPFFQDRGHSDIDVVIHENRVEFSYIANEAIYGDPLKSGELPFIRHDKVNRSECVDLGKGEWTAETLEDARQMACDFAKGCS